MTLSSRFERTRRCLAFSALMTVALAGRPASANLFLYVDGIPGGSTDPMHRDWIVAKDYSLDASRSVPAGGTPQNGAAQLSDLVVTAEASVASPGVFEALLLGQSIETVRLELMQTSGGDNSLSRPIAQWELDRVFVTDFKTIAQTNGEVVDSYQFYFDEITYRYLSYDAAGVLLGQAEFSFNRATGEEAVSTSGEGAAPPDDGAVVCQATVDLTADFDSDGLVDGRDFLLWQRGLGMTAGATREDGDTNGDGLVDQIDFLAWQESYGNLTPLPAGIPEPTSCLLAMIACMVLAAHMR